MHKNNVHYMFTAAYNRSVLYRARQANMGKRKRKMKKAPHTTTEVNHDRNTSDNDPHADQTGNK